MNSKKIAITFRNLFYPGASLSQKASRGIFWVFLSRGIIQVFSLVKLAIVARLLGPEAFGIMGIALIVRSFLYTISQTGINYALIHKKEDISTFLNTAWTITIIRNGILFILIILIAPFAASFFDEPRAKPVIMTVGSVLLLDGIMNIGIVYFQKELEYHKEFIFQISAVLVNIIVVITLAIILQNVWALVFALLAEAFTKLILSYIMQPFRPRIEFKKDKAKELLNYGIWILLSGILGFIILESGNIIVGNLIGVVAIGLYQMASKIANLVVTQISHVIARVTIPTYAKIQDSKARLRKTYLNVLQITGFITFPFAALIFILARDITQIILGSEWISMVDAMKILVLAGFIRSIAATSGPLFLATGKPQIDSYLQGIRFIIIIVLIYPFTIRWGMVGVAFVTLISISISNIGFSYKAIKYTESSIKEFLKFTITPIIIGSIVMLTIFMIKTMYPITNVGLLFLITMFGAFLYLLIAYLFDKLFGYGIYVTIYSNIRRIN